MVIKVDSETSAEFLFTETVSARDFLSLESDLCRDPGFRLSPEAFPFSCLSLDLAGNALLLRSAGRTGAWG